MPDWFGSYQTLVDSPILFFGQSCNGCIPWRRHKEHE